MMNIDIRLGSFWRLGDTTTSPLSDSTAAIHRDRLRVLDSLRPPPTLPVEYATDADAVADTGTGTDTAKGSSTKISIASIISTHLVATRIESVRLADLVLPLHRSLLAFIQSPEYPSDYLRPCEYVRQAMQDRQEEALMIQPSGEAGLSHWLKTSLFDFLNKIAVKFYRHQVTRYWKVIGIGKTGKTDWGLYVDGKLCVIVELKPSNASRVFDVNAMQDVCTSVKDKPVGNIRDPLVARKKENRVLVQMYAQYCNPLARSTARYALCLCESTKTSNGRRTYSGAMLFHRTMEAIQLGAAPISEVGDDPTLELPVTNPTLALIALTFMPLDMLAPETSILPVPPAPQDQIVRNEVEARTAGFGVNPTPTGMRTRFQTRALETPGTPNSQHGPMGTGVGQGQRGRGRGHRGGGGSVDGRRRSGGPQDSEAFADAATTGHGQAAAELSHDEEDGSEGSNSTDVSMTMADSNSSDLHSTPPTSPLPSIIELDQLEHLTIKSAHGDLTLYGPIDWTLIRRGAEYLALPLVRHPAPRLDGSRDTIAHADAVCTTEVGRGALWTVYDFVRPSDKETEEPSPSGDLVVKLCQPSSFQAEEEDAERYTRRDAEHGVKRELDVLFGRAKSLWGRVTPRVHGVYVGLPDKGCVSGEEIWALVMEKGDKLGTEDEILLDLQYHEKYSIMDQYHSLHSIGVLHGDVRPNNVLFVPRRAAQQSKSSLAATHGLARRLGVITDFERSVFRHEVYGVKDEWERRCRLEMEMVRDLVMI